MAVVSTSKRADFELIHRHRRIRQFFEFVLNIEDCAKAKPDPDPYLRALKRFNAHPEEAVAIEDSSRGLGSAIAAGLRCIIIHNNFTSTQDFTAAWRILGSLRELPDVLSGFA
jgi:beta-phosphoglucomutase-like phosphatase (HAD superfamily)